MIFDNLTSDESTDYPAKIKEIAEKELIFNVQISVDNVSLKSKIFEVIDSYDTSYFTPTPSQGQMTMCSASTSFENSVDLSSYLETLGSIKSVSKNIKMEK
ncbi:uncharacterized protein LOC141724453 isoform X2 [Apium graveolens]|uniref:uncharacterized protein LOC141724453 isoform X2 n=1 Tax=Apium graveolens TaxID=4045 RepID=UPI003D7B1418